MLFFTVCNAWLTSQDSNVIINLKHSAKNIDLEFTISGKYKLLVHIKHANNTRFDKAYKDILEKYRNLTDTWNYYLLMNFKTEKANQLKEIKVIENPICKIFEIDVTQKEIKKPDPCLEEVEFNLDDSILEFENMKFDSIQKRKDGGNKRHENTTIIKTEIIKPMFLYRRNANAHAKVSEISDAIIKELNGLQGGKTSEKVQNFLEKYSINSDIAIQKAINYIKKNDDGGQITTWCYELSKNKL